MYVSVYLSKIFQVAVYCDYRCIQHLQQEQTTTTTSMGQDKQNEIKTKQKQTEEGRNEKYCHTIYE